VHHRDRGVQCLSIRDTERLAEAGIELSVGRTGDSRDPHRLELASHGIATRARFVADLQLSLAAQPSEELADRAGLIPDLVGLFYRAGELTPIHIPTEAEQAVRDLLRCREDSVPPAS
jgi:hypothetical protein